MTPDVTSRPVVTSRPRAARRLMSAVAVAALSTAFVPTAGAAISRLLSFGDSLSDVGNVSAATFGFIPGSFYFNGRFSNGPIWLDTLATRLGVPASTPSLFTGNNYAIGGSRVSDAAVFLGQSVPSFSTIVTGYLATNPTIQPDTLVTIWIGSNDYLNNALLADPVALSATVESAMLGLAQRGARQFAVVSVPPVGFTPAVSANGPLAIAGVNAAVQQYNARLAQLPAKIETAVPGADVFYVDTYAPLQALISNPASFGLTNVTDRAFINGSIVSNPDQYLWWDDVHPTRRGHALIADLASAAIPEPASLALLLTPLALLTHRPRRAASAI